MDEDSHNFHQEKKKRIEKDSHNSTCDAVSNNIKLIRSIPSKPPPIKV